MADDDHGDDDDASPSSSQSSQSDDQGSNDIRIVTSSIDDDGTRQAVEQIMAERETLKSELAEVTTTLKKINEQQEKQQVEQQRTQRLDQLKSINQQLYDKHKDETDIDKLDSVIETAELLTNDFPAYDAGDQDDDEPSGPPLRRDLKSGDFI